MRSALILVTLGLLAGCVAPGTTTTEDLDAATLPPVPLAEPFIFEGDFGPGAVVCAVLACVGHSSGNRATDIDVDGLLTGADLTLTWTASSPLMQRLRIGISYLDGDSRRMEYVDGPSPLVFSVKDIEVASDDEPRLFVWVASSVPMGLVTVHTPQTFKVDGTLDLTPKA